MDAPASQWFPDEPGRNAAEAAYLDQLRQEAADWTVAGICPEDTASQVWFTPLYLELEIPGLAVPQNTLQVAYWTNHPRGHALDGMWGDEHLLDNPHREDLTACGATVDPEECASWTAAWLLRQLRRSIVRQEWLSGDRVVAATWRFDDTGRVLHATGSSRRRFLRRRADRVVEVRWWEAPVVRRRAV
ncbi:hypothetical protein [Catellatospora tritici]|uniref:hypothetical protein n=1 Tax=Catellatospora tritici TaxID=2851566 RepID=UPI001C2D47EC|nr:hypothetical protein [Catellatospora tritici]MBV1852843.1 hypothetical protein [Catellatospora tritici]